MIHLSSEDVGVEYSGVVRQRMIQDLVDSGGIRGDRGAALMRSSADLLFPGLGEIWTVYRVGDWT